MNHLVSSRPVATSADHAPFVGQIAAGITAVLTTITFAIAFFTPPLSGPFCSGDCFVYPFHDIAGRFPRDYIWMGPATVLMLVLVVLMASLHQVTPTPKQVYSLIGLAFAMLAAAFLVADYFIQLAVVQPSLELGETDGIALLTQFNPHGLFIALEDSGYLLIGVALFAVVPLFSGRTRVETALRLLFIANFVLSLVGLVWISLEYGIFREYRFEVLVISLNWLTLIGGGALLTVFFGRIRR
jgi:hypothetical protein